LPKKNLDIKKGFISKAFPGKQPGEIDYFTTAFTESTTAVTAESTLVAAAAAAAVIESAFAFAASAAALAFSAPPQATIATAKPHTITDAINFFIV
jgi:hypothetical protein